MKNAVNEGKLLIAIKGKIFDVTSANHLFGGDGEFSHLVGSDISVALGSLRLDNPVDQYSKWEDELSEEEITVLDDYYKHYEKNYKIIGELDDNPQTLA